MSVRCLPCSIKCTPLMSQNNSSLFQRLCCGTCRFSRQILLAQGFCKCLHSGCFYVRGDSWRSWDPLFCDIPGWLSNVQVCGSEFAIGVDSAVFWLPLFFDDRTYRIRERTILFFEKKSQTDLPPVFFKLFMLCKLSITLTRNSFDTRTKTTLEKLTTFRR